MSIYELRLMFEWGGPADESVVWGMNEAAKEKFGGYAIKLDDLPISDELGISAGSFALVRGGESKILRRISSGISETM